MINIAVDVATSIVMMWVKNLDEADHFLKPLIVGIFEHVELDSIVACEVVMNL